MANKPASVLGSRGYIDGCSVAAQLSSIKDTACTSDDKAFIWDQLTSRGRISHARIPGEMLCSRNGMGPPNV